MASREADHQLIASLLQREASSNSASVPSEQNEYQTLLKQREQLLHAAQRELLSGSGVVGAGPVYHNLQNQIREIDVRLQEHNK